MKRIVLLAEMHCVRGKPEKFAEECKWSAILTAYLRVQEGASASAITGYSSNVWAPAQNSIIWGDKE